MNSRSVDRSHQTPLIRRPSPGAAPLWERSIDRECALRSGASPCHAGNRDQWIAPTEPGSCDAGRRVPHLCGSDPLIANARCDPVHHLATREFAISGSLPPNLARAMPVARCLAFVGAIHRSRMRAAIRWVTLPHVNSRSVDRSYRTPLVRCPSPGASPLWERSIDRECALRSGASPCHA
jgi:hypothetical protein